MRQEAIDQYNKALKAGQKFYRNAISRGDYPYPLVLDEILNESAVAGYTELGLVNVPSGLIVGTKSAGRVAALAGNFMPLLSFGSEFSEKWINLCCYHLSDEGIRDPVKCYEYMGKFYVQEGNKRVSVLMSYQAPRIPAVVTRIVPQYSEDHDVQVYYEFLKFYELSRLYGVEFHHRGAYAKLQAALGFDKNHVWTEDERRSFLAGFTYFRSAFDRLTRQEFHVTPAEALLVWLQVFSFSEIKEQTLPELTKKLSGIWTDIVAQESAEPIEFKTAPEDKSKGILSKILGVGHSEHINIAFVYAFSPDTSVWTRAHDYGRQYLEERLGQQVSVRVYHAYNHDYYAAMLSAVKDGAELIFATNAQMISACRKVAALHSDVKILNCALSLPYTGVRMYYSRTHEGKFITGAIAGVMADNDVIGYVANYPIFGTAASINAFALGVRLTNPRARIKLRWSCLPGDPIQDLIKDGATVISNRDAASPNRAQGSFVLGTYKVQPDGSLLPLATPYWHWGRLYEKIVRSIFNGAWEQISRSKAINYWWGMDSGVIDVQFGDNLPDGVRSLGGILKSGIVSGNIAPFQTRIVDQHGILRNDGTRNLSPEDILTMDWFCENVDGEIPGFEELLPMSRDMVRVLGLYRQQLLPEREAGQL